MAEGLSVPLPPGSYAQWIRGVLGTVRASGQSIAPLFESSVPEPRAELAALIAGAFAEPVTDRYTSAFAGGNPFVVRAIAARYGVDPGQVLCTTGATGGLALLYRALLRPGDEVLVETPGFDLLGLLASEYGAAVRRFERPAPDFRLDVGRIAAALGPRTRLVVLTNLHNPSGMAAGDAALRELAGLAERTGITVIVDEVYGDFAADGGQGIPACAFSPRFVSLSSMTKSFALSTLRCGWIVAGERVIATVRDLAERTEFAVSNLAHAVAALVLERREAFFGHTARILASARPLLDRHFARWEAEGLVEGPLPASGCIAFPRLVGIDDTVRFAEDLVAGARVAVVPGEFFGAAGHVRIGFGHAPQVLEPALEALGDALVRRRDHAARAAVGTGA